MNEQEIIQSLNSEGYTKVYIHDAKPNENYPSHSHPWDTKLIILNEQLEVEINNKHLILGPGDKIDILRDVVHKGKAGIKGCRYIVAEKNN